MAEQDFLKLIDKYLAGKASVAEEQLLQSFFDSFQAGDEWDERIHGVKQELEDKMLNRLQDGIIRSKKAGKAKIITFFNLRNIAAAVILFALTGAGWHYLQNKPATKPELVKQVKERNNDILPGTNKATLTLANGKQLVLNSAKIGVVARLNNISVKKTSDGQLVYQVAAAHAGANDKAIEYNTVTTPRGGQFQVILPDGSKVWLNAESSLKFPTQFNGDERRVTLTGEAYFEVAKNAARPFKVTAGHLDVKVLGTHFDIMAYENEDAIKTTLLEGSVELISAGGNDILKPGEQGRLNKRGELTLTEVNTNEAIAWKNGYFEFNRASIQTIMNQVTRWYDADVAYEGKIPDDEFVGKIERSVKLSQLLHILQLSNVHFRIDGKKIIVTP